MAGPDRSFNRYLENYKRNAAPADLEAYEIAAAQFALANELMEQRKAQGLTQHQLAEAAGVRQPEISRIERGQNVTVETVTRIARVLNVRVGLVPGTYDASPQASPRPRRAGARRLVST